MTKVIHFCLYTALAALAVTHAQSHAYLEAAIHFGLAVVVVLGHEPSRKLVERRQSSRCSRRGKHGYPDQLGGPVSTWVIVLTIEIDK
jgi:hypothetical protein